MTSHTGIDKTKIKWGDESGEEYEIVIGLHSSDDLACDLEGIIHRSSKPYSSSPMDRRYMSFPSN